MEKHLHIISLDVPYPATYGGVYDLFYKLPALQQQGVKIHLHCFAKHRVEQTELDKFCAEVFYYERDANNKNLFSGLPYIVASRRNQDLLQRLLKDDHPIFMEGVHCTYITTDERFKTRKMFVRIHNVENEYYKRLFTFSNNLKKKIYYLFESKKLAAYEKILAKNATAYWSVTEKDADYYRYQLGCKTMDYLPVFIPPWQAPMPEGMGSYCLYHGNLQVEENDFAVKWLIKNVFNKIEIPFVIAGSKPSKKITRRIEKYKHICIVANPEEKQMQDIISKAHIHVLPSFNNTGIKIKLLNALYNGRHCIANDAMLAGNVFKETCHVVNTANEFRERITLLYHQPFTLQEKNFRRQLLQKEFSNEANAKQMVKWIWTEYV